MPRLCIGLRRDRSSATGAASAVSDAGAVPALSALIMRGELRRESHQAALSVRSIRNPRYRARIRARAKIAPDALAFALIFHRNPCSFCPLIFGDCPPGGAQYFAACESPFSTTQKQAETRIFIRFFSVCEFAKKQFSGYNISYFKHALKRRESPSTLNLERLDNFCAAGERPSLFSEAANLHRRVCRISDEQRTPRAARIVPERSVEWKPLRREII